MWLLRPGVFRITPAQFATDLRIKPFPKTCQITGLLYGPLVRRQQVYNNRNVSASNTRRLGESEEILEPRRDPRRLTSYIVHFHLPRSQRQALGCNVVQQPFTGRAETRSKRGNETPIGCCLL